MSSIYLGIDPGKSGAICYVDVFGNPEIVTKTDKTYSEIWRSLRDVAYDHTDIRACIELVHAMPSQGVVSTFSFGESYGALLGMLAAAEISFTKVRPSIWCKSFDLKKMPDESSTDWKDRHKQLAQDIFPGMDITHATADALLIAEYCRRTNI